MRWLFFLFLLLIPTVLANENVSENETLNISFVDNSSFDNFSEVIDEFQNETLEENVSKNIFSVSSFFIFSFLQGTDYSLDLFEFLLESSLGEGGEYNASFFTDEQSSPNSDSQGSDYSSDVGGYGFLSSPTVIVSIVSYCGDGSCDSGEACDTCEVDCGACSVQKVALPGGRGGQGCQDGYIRIDDQCVLVENKSEELIENVSQEIEFEEGENDSEEKPSDEGERRGITGKIIAEEVSKYSILGIVAVVLFFGIILIRYLKKKKKSGKKKRDYVYKKQFDKISKIKNPRIKYKKSKFKTLNNIRKLYR